jgi:hypothetical protein
MNAEYLDAKNVNRCCIYGKRLYPQKTALHKITTGKDNGNSKYEKGRARKSPHHKELISISIIRFQ